MGVLGLVYSLLSDKTRFRIFVFVILTLFLVINLSAKTSYGSGLDLNDKTSNAQHLTNSGASEFTSSLPFTASDKAVSTSGSGSSYLYASDHSANSFTNNFTISTWVRFSALPTDATALLVGKDGAYALNYHPTLGLRLYTYPFDAVTVAWTATANTWYHVAVTFSSNQVKFYVNGAQQGSTQTAANSSTADTSNSLIIGQGSYAGTHNGTVQLDDVRLYNAVITDFSNRSQELTGSESNLTAYYPIEDGATPTPTPTAGSVGWDSAGESWTYASATTITVPSDATAKYSPGDKIRLKQGGSYKYFYVVGVTSTVLTVTGGSDYSVANATITDNYFAKGATPVGFPQYFNWTPTYSASDSLTWTNVETDVARFSITGRTVHVRLSATGTSGGTASNYLYATTPVTAVDDEYTDGAVWTYDSGGTGNNETGRVRALSNGNLMFMQYDSDVNWPVSRNVGVGTSYTYEF